jgi:DNA gyrase subunit B
VRFRAPLQLIVLTCKGITIHFGTRGRNLFCEVFHDEGLKEYIRYLDVNREPIIAHVISMDNEKNTC